MTALVLLSTILESATYRPSAGLVVLVPVAPFLPYFELGMERVT